MTVGTAAERGLRGGLTPAALVAHEPARLLVEDVFLGDGADRARLRIAGIDETVHVEVAAPCDNCRIPTR